MSPYGLGRGRGAEVRDLGVRWLPPRSAPSTSRIGWRDPLLVEIASISARLKRTTWHLAEAKPGARALGIRCRGCLHWSSGCTTFMASSRKPASEHRVPEAGAIPTIAMQWSAELGARHRQGPTRVRRLTMGMGANLRRCPSMMRAASNACADERPAPVVHRTAIDVTEHEQMTRRAAPARGRAPAGHRPHPKSWRVRAVRSSAASRWALAYFDVEPSTNGARLLTGSKCTPRTRRG